MGLFIIREVGGEGVFYSPKGKVLGFNSEADADTFIDDNTCKTSKSSKQAYVYYDMFLKASSKVKVITYKS